MFDFYIDDSGSHSPDLLVLGGVLARREGWDAYCSDAAVIQADYQIRFFHTKHIKSQNGKLYAHLSRRQRQDLVRDLVAAMRKTRGMGFAVGVPVTEFRRLGKNAYGSPLRLCMEGLLHLIYQHMAEPIRRGYLFNFIIEDGHGNTEELCKYLEFLKADNRPQNLDTLIDSGHPYAVISLHKIVTPTMTDILGRQSEFMQIGLISKETKQNAPPLWAADLVAHRFRANKLVGQDPFFREPARAAGGYIPTVGYCFDEESLLEHLRQEDEVREMEQAARARRHKMTKFALAHGANPIKVADNFVMLSNLDKEGFEDLISGAWEIEDDVPPAKKKE